MDSPKCCTLCGESFPATTDNFHRDKSRTDGLYPWCKPCRKAKAAAHYIANRERILESNATWQRKNTARINELQRKWAKENPDRMREYKQRYREKNSGKSTAEARRWREENREHYREWSRAYDEANREKKRENARRLREANRERYNTYQAKRRALKVAGGGNVTAEQVLQRLALQQGCCQWCSESLPVKYHVDHRIPLSRGGAHSSNNIVIACQSCNLSKSDKLPFSEWLPPNPLGLD